MQLKTLKFSSIVVLAVFAISNSVFAQQIPSSQNPLYSAVINPKHNSAISPKYNPVLNPQHNAVINPQNNPAINPQHNAVINPQFNNILNPDFNSRISAQRSGWSGYYVFNLNADMIGVIVRSDDRNLTYFDDDLQWSSYLSSNSRGGYNWFTVDGDWIGYFVPNGGRGYNLFNKEGEWLAFIL